MIKNTITAGAYTSGNIPSVTLLKTNSIYIFKTSSNIFEITAPGITDIEANVVVTATSTGSLSLQAFGNGVAIPVAVDTQSVESGSTYTFHLNDAVRTLLSNGDYAELTFALSGACTIVSGDIILSHKD